MEKSPPRISEGFDYRTKSSLKNKETWNTAQTRFGKFGTVTFSMVLLATAADIALIFVRLNKSKGFAVFLIIVAVQAAALTAVIVMAE